MDRGTRASMIDSKSDLSRRLQCRLLQVPRGSHYYKPRAMSPLNAYLMRVIDQQYQRTPFYGVPRMTDFINHACGYKVSKKRIERLYKIMDIRALGPNPFTSRADKTAYKYPYLLANLKDVYPNQVWVADITYLGLKNGFMYLFAIMDYATRYIYCLGHQACAQGFKVQYHNVQKLFLKMKMARVDGSIFKSLDKLNQTDLLILDDFGLTQLEQQQRYDLLDLIEDRHAKKATIISSQLPVANWYHVIGDETIADAILDRLIHTSHRIELKGESMRRKKL